MWLYKMDVLNKTAKKANPFNQSTLIQPSFQKKKKTFLVLF